MSFDVESVGFLTKEFFESQWNPGIRQKIARSNLDREAELGHKVRRNFIESE